MHRSAIVYDDRYLDYDFGPGHPLRPERIPTGLSLLSASKVFDANTDYLSHAPASVEELLCVHDIAYVEAIQRASTGSNRSPAVSSFGLTASGDNPPFRGMHEAAAAVAGGSIEGMRSIMEGRLDHVFNPAGGLHHAHRARASGFCIYDDPALAAAIALREFRARVLYVDFDCHHGDGVQWVFYDDPRVLTLSFHESGKYLFPGSGGIEERGEGAGLGYSVNVPMQPYTRDEDWQRAIAEVLPQVATRFRPDVIISAHGADTHLFDPLTHLQLTTRAFAFQARLTHELAHHLTGGRWLALGSGGYDWQRVVPRSWAILWSEMAGRPLPDRLPDAWVADQQERERIPPAFLDGDIVRRVAGPNNHDERANRETLTDVLALVS